MKNKKNFMESPFNINELEKASKEVLNIKNNVQKYRVWKRLTQKELAENIGVSVSQISLIENKLSNPRESTKHKICEFFGVNHDQIFYTK